MDKLKTLFYQVVFWWKTEKLKKIVRRSGVKNIIICDIDNTLIKRKDNSKRSFYQDFHIYQGVVSHVLEVQKEKGALLIFLSSRSVSLYYKTKNVLSRLFAEDNPHLILVRKASDKLFYLDLFRQIGSVFFLDDLSDGEGEKPVTYDKVINDVLKMENVSYTGIKELSKLQIVKKQ